MKIRLLSLFLLGFCALQAQDKDCAAKAKTVDSLVVANNFESAFDLWKSSRKCVSESLYRSGEKILLNELAQNLSESARAERSNMLLQLYADYDASFPANTNGNAVKKAMYLYRLDANSPEIYSLLDGAFAKDRNQFTDAHALQAYFGQINKRFVSADKAVTESVLVAKSDDILAHVEKLYAQTNAKDYHNIAESIAKIIASELPCDRRDSIYAKQFEAKKSDSQWVRNVTMRLSRDCQRSPMYYKAASQWYALSPDSKSAYHLAQASVQQRKTDDAAKYFAIAAEGETDPSQKAEIYYTMATREITDGPKAIGLLRQAIAAKPNFGKAYLLMAEVYASTDCGKTPFEKKARYKLAAQTALKAIQADATMKKAAESRAALYNKNAPTAVEIKDAKMSGKTISYGCGINESVTL